jgi:hypothetical protein
MTALVAIAVAVAMLAGWRGAASPASAEPLPALKALSSGAFRPGEWTVRSLDHRLSEHDRSICLTSAERLARGGYFRDARCSYTIIEDTAERATINYRCEGGWGRTDIRRDADSLYIVAAQGLRDGQPFARRVELRRKGDCKEEAPR